MSTFVNHSPTHVERCDGPIATLLECDSNELLGTGWRKVLHKGDLDVAHQFHADITSGRGGTYLFRNVSKSGDTFYFRVNTLVVPSKGIAHGHAVLEDYVLNRKHFPITQAVLKRGIR